MQPQYEYQLIAEEKLVILPTNDSNKNKLPIKNSVSSLTEEPACLNLEFTLYEANQLIRKLLKNNDCALAKITKDIFFIEQPSFETLQDYVQKLLLAGLKVELTKPSSFNSSVTPPAVITLKDSLEIIITQISHTLPKSNSSFNFFPSVLQVIPTLNTATFPANLIENTREWIRQRGWSESNEMAFIKNVEEFIIFDRNKIKEIFTILEWKNPDSLAEEYFQKMLELETKQKHGSASKKPEDQTSTNNSQKNTLGKEISKSVDDGCILPKPSCSTKFVSTTLPDSSSHLLTPSDKATLDFNLSLYKANELISKLLGHNCKLSPIGVILFKEIQSFETLETFASVLFCAGLKAKFTETINHTYISSRFCPLISRYIKLRESPESIISKLSSSNKASGLGKHIGNTGELLPKNILFFRDEPFSEFKIKQDSELAMVERLSRS